ncbi:MAG TPA: hypothetical protein VJ719_01265 [Chthoniobacterales bacterium]|nr:hypothetical protein [Chthoniobacterales bacterium]
MRMVTKRRNLFAVAALVTGLCASTLHGDTSASAYQLTQQAGELHDKGDFDGAYKRLEAAIAIDRNHWPAYYWRALIRVYRHDCNGALSDCDVVLRLQPKFVAAAVLRASANHCLKRYAAELAELNHVIKLHPPSREVLSKAYNQRAWLYATCPDPKFRNGKQALKDAKAANGYNGGEADILDTFAAAYAETGDFAAAIKTQENAIASIHPALLVPTPGKDPKASYQRHLDQLKKGQPIRD